MNDAVERLRAALAERYRIERGLRAVVRVQSRNTDLWVLRAAGPK